MIRISCGGEKGYLGGSLLGAFFYPYNMFHTIQKERMDIEI